MIDSCFFFLNFDCQHNVLTFTLVAGWFYIPVNILELCLGAQLSYLKLSLILLNLAFKLYVVEPQ